MKLETRDAIRTGLKWTLTSVLSLLFVMGITYYAAGIKTAIAVAIISCGLAAVALAYVWNSLFPEGDSPRTKLAISFGFLALAILWGVRLLLRSNPEPYDIAMPVFYVCMSVYHFLAFQKAKAELNSPKPTDPRDANHGFGPALGG